MDFALFKIPPHPLYCQGIVLALLLAVGRIGVVIQYFRITSIWLRWATSREGESNRPPIYLAWIFRFCALSGYALPAMTLIHPIFYWVAIPALCAEIVASQLFIKISEKYQYLATSETIAAGQAAREVMTDQNIETMNPEDLIKMLREKLDHGS